MSSEILPFTLAAAAIIGSPGPGPMMLAGLGTAFGFARCMPFMFGQLAGIAGTLVVIATGLLSLINAVPYAKLLLTLASLAYLAYLAFKIATAPPLAQNTVAAAPSAATGLGLGLTNPKAYAGFSALFASFNLGFSPLADASTKGGICLALTLLFSLVWLGLGNLATGFLRAPRTARAVNVTLALLMLGSVLWSLWPRG